MPLYFVLKTATAKLISSRSFPTTISSEDLRILSSPKISMLFPCLNSIFRLGTAAWWPQFLHALAWTVLLTLMVSLASFPAEMAFVSAVHPSSSFSRSCKAADEGLVRIPLDFPGEKLCLPAHMVKRSSVDFFVPTVFAGLVVVGSACVIRSLGLWESETV